MEANRVVEEKLKRTIRDVPDFPKPGIVFKDITPLLHHHRAFSAAIQELVERYRKSGIDVVAGIESRGFLFGAPLAHELGVAFVPVRKQGKLPYKTIRMSYDLEYGSATIEMHTDAISPGEKVILLDDLLATGGTIRAACDLVKRMGGQVVGLAFLIELSFLHGRDKLREYDIFSILQYDSE